MKTKQHERGRQTMTRLILFLTTITLALACWVPTKADAKTIHVKASATGSATGLSWADAYTSLQDGLAAAVAGDEIWVAAGTYKPDQGKGLVAGNKNASFRLKDDIALYGGFIGNESDLAQRDWTVNETIVSGDLKGDDMAGFINFADNANNIFMGINIVIENVLDGFTITGGNAGTNYVTDSGGGIYLDKAILRIENCTFDNNRARIGGGAVFAKYSTVTINNSLFKRNSAGEYHGGAFYGYSGTTLSATNSLFINNTAKGMGGAVYASGIANASFTHCVFENNSADMGGGVAGLFMTIQYCLFKKITPPKWAVACRTASAQQSPIASLKEMPLIQAVAFFLNIILFLRQTP